MSATNDKKGCFVTVESLVLLFLMIKASYRVNKIIILNKQKIMAPKFSYFLLNLANEICIMQCFQKLLKLCSKFLERSRKNYFRKWHE